MLEVTVIGNLGGDPEMRYTPSGQSVTNFNVASNRRWRDRDGNQQEVTDWIRVAVWGAQAEACSQYLARGSQVYIRGRLEARLYDDRNGETRVSLDVTAFDVQFLGGGQQQDGGGQQRQQQSQGQRQQGGNQQRQQGGQRQQQRQQQPPPEEDSYYDDDGDGGWNDADDLPF